MGRGCVDKQLIIEEAAALANETGFSNVSLKLLSERLNIKAPSLYNHITNLEELKQELAAYGWEELTGKLTEVLIGEAGDEAIRLGCCTFYDYAVANPGVFEAMAFCNGSDGKTDTDASEKFMSILFRVLGKRNIGEKNAYHIMRLARSYIEGFALLAGNEAFDTAKYPLRESFEFGVEAIIESIHRLEKQNDNA